MSLERKLPLLVTAILVATLATAVGLAYREVRNTATVAAVSQIETVARQLASSSGQSITQRKKLLEEVAESPQVQAIAGNPQNHSGANTPAVVRTAVTASLTPRH